MNYSSGHRLTICQPLFMHGLAPPSGSGGSTLPISSMRDPNVNNKRSRLVIPSCHTRSSSDHLPPLGRSYSYHPGQNSTPFSRPSNWPHQHHSSPHASQHHALFSPRLFLLTFLPLPRLYPCNRIFLRTNSSNQAGLNSNMIRGLSGTSQSSGPTGGGGSSAAGGDDLFATFLDADEQTRQVAGIAKKLPTVFYVLSIVAVVSDIATCIIEVSIVMTRFKTIPLQVPS